MFIPAGLAVAGEIAPRDGWRVIESDLAHAELLERLREAIPAEGMGLVTEAGPTEVRADAGYRDPRKTG